MVYDPTTQWDEGGTAIEEENECIGKTTDERTSTRILLKLK